MRYYVIELRGRTANPDFSLLLLRFGKTIRISLHTHHLPQPFVGTDPDTGEALARFYLQTDRQHDQALTTACANFERQSRDQVKCHIQHVTAWPPAPTSHW